MFNRLKSLCLAAFIALFALPVLLFAQSGESALGFDGIDDYVQVPDDPSLDMTNGFTIAAWIFLDEYTEWASIVTKGGFDDGSFALGPNNYTIHQSGPSAGSGEFGHLRFTTESGLFGDSNSLIPLGEWHHIAVVFDGNAVRFFLDGRPDGEQPLFGPLPANDEPLNIGVDFPGGDEYWHGRIDELKIWSKPLKATHILAAMHGHSSPMASALVGFWRFDEKSGNIAHDQSREKNNGQLINGPTRVSPGAPIGNAGQSNTGQPAELISISNFPNPLNPETEIRFAIPQANHVVVKIFNLLGAEVRTLVDEPREAGYHRARWDGKDKHGKQVASGIYLYQLRAGNFSQVKKMSLLR